MQSVAICRSTSALADIDGDLSDSLWREATMLGPFVSVATHDLPSQSVYCRVIRTADELLVALECWEADMGSLTTDASERDDARAWADDCIHLFIAPTDPRNCYYHIVVTAANVVFDESVREAAQDRNPGWDCQVRSETALLGNRWTCELAIPFADIPGFGPGTSRCAFNIGRAERARGEWSSWSALNASFHEFANFGQLLWSDGPVFTGLDIPAPFVGPNEFRFSTGGVGAPCTAELQAIRGRQVFPKVPVAVTGDLNAAFAYEITSEGPGAVRLVLRSTDGVQVYYASPPVRFDVPALGGLLRTVRSRLEAIRAQCRKLPGDARRKALAAEIGWMEDDAAATDSSAARVVRLGSQRRAAWQEQYEHALTLVRATRALEHKCAMAPSASEALPVFALGTETSLRKLPPDDWQYSMERVVSLAGARCERESGQVVVASLGEPLQGVTVDWTPLTSAAGATIARERVEVRRVGYVSTRRPVYPVERVGRWPDPLMPPTAFDVPAGEVQPLWVTVSIPADAVPDTYRGTVSVSVPGEEAQSVALSVNVWELSLPVRGRFKTAFGMVFEGDVSQWYGWEEDPGPEVRRRFCDVLLRNRVSPAGLYVGRSWPPPEDVAWCRERGMSAVSLGNLGAATPERLAALAEDARGLSDAGLLEHAYVFGAGSLLPDGVASSAEAFDRVRRVLPGVRRACPVSPTRPLWGHVNLWGTLVSDYDHISAQRRRYLGDEVWWYVCCGPRHPYPNLFIDYPATDARVLFWAAHKYGVTGFFYYEVAMWASNMQWEDVGDPSIALHDDPQALAGLREGKRWPEVRWNAFTFSRYNGDGQLIYPGPEATPIPSLRLEVVRDGIEDYELLVLLEDYARLLKERDPAGKYAFLVNEAMQMANASTAVVEDLTHFTSSPEVILAQRAAVAHQAVRIFHTLQKLGVAVP